MLNQSFNSKTALGQLQLKFFTTFCFSCIQDFALVSLIILTVTFLSTTAGVQTEHIFILVKYPGKYFVQEFVSWLLCWVIGSSVACSQSCPIVFYTICLNVVLFLLLPSTLTGRLYDGGDDGRSLNTPHIRVIPHDIWKTL